MKKHFILTSLLTLTACAGGSHSSGMSDYERAAASNTAVTGMKSFVVVGGSNPTVNTNARISSNGIKTADGGTMYDLSNVDLHTTTFTNDFINPDDGASILFETDDNGKIIKLALVGPEQFGEEGIVGTRNNETESFSGHGVLTYQTEQRVEENGESHFVPDEYGNPVLITVSDPFDFNLTYNSFGDDFSDSSLQYSDFGQLIITAGTDEEDVYFAGGYKVKKINPDDVQNTTSLDFTGIADGAVYGKHKYRINNVEQSDEKELALRDNNAKLTLLQNGESVVKAKFDNWYDVTTTMDTNGKVNGIQFDNLADNVDTDFVFSHHNMDGNGNFLSGINYDTEHVGKPTAYVEENTDNLEYTNVIRNGFVEYFGDDNNPSEAVGTIKYAEDGGSAYVDHYIDNNGDPHDIYKMKSIEFDMGFGAKRD